jgi:hypothetical protein
MTSRVINVNEFEKPVIMVGENKYYVTLVFKTFTVNIFERKGQIFTRQLYNHSIESIEEDDETENEESPYLEGQPFDYVDKFTTKDRFSTPDRKPKGFFNEDGPQKTMGEHEVVEDIELEDTKTRLEFTSSYLSPGDTQVIESPDLLEGVSKFN